MADAGAIRAGRAFVEAFLDSSALDRGLARVMAKMKTWGAAISDIGAKMLALGGAATFGLGSAAKIFADMGSGLLDASQRTGFAVEELSALKFAAEQAGASFEDLETAIKFMQKGGFGRSAGDFKRIGDEIAKIEDPMQRTQEAVRIFGRGGASMLSPIMDGLTKTTKEAEELGLVMSTSSAQAADKLGDSFTLLTTSLKFAVATIGAQLAPMLTDLIGKAIPLIASFVQWTKANRGMIISAFQLTAAVAALGAGLLVVGKALALGGVVLGFLGPFGILVGLITAGTAAWMAFTESGRSAAAALLQFGGAFEGIKNAFKAGDLLLAGKIAFAGLKVAWFEMINSMKQGWHRAVLDFKDGIIGLTASVALLGIAWNKSIGVMSEKEAAAESKAVVDQMNAFFAETAKNRALGVAVDPELAKAKADLARLNREAKFAGAKALQVEMAGGLAAPLFSQAGSGAGTFSAVGAGRMGAGVGWQQLVDVQKDGAKLLEQIRDEIRMGGVRFA